jgi:hypothetical protein
MRVFQTGDVIKATHISGPSHNFLGLVLIAVNDPVDTLLEEVCLAQDAGKSRCIDSKRLRDTVHLAVQQVSEKSGTGLQVAKIQYVATDSPRFDIYAELAAKIAEYFLIHSKSQR